MNKNSSEILSMRLAYACAPHSRSENLERLGIAPAYLSKIENNLDRPPSAKVVEKLAEILNLEKAELLQMANRVPSNWDDAFKENPRAQDFLRVAMKSGLSPEELEKLIMDSKSKIPKRR